MADEKIRMGDKMRMIPIAYIPYTIYCNKIDDSMPILEHFFGEFHFNEVYV